MKKHTSTTVTPDTMTVPQFARRLKVSIKTIRRLYQNYKLIPPPQIVRHGHGTRAVWFDATTVVDRGKRIVALQRDGVRVQAIGSILAEEEAKRDWAEIDNRGRELAERVLASEQAREACLDLLAVRIGLATRADDAGAREFARPYVNVDVLTQLFRLLLGGYSAVVIIKPSQPALYVTTDFALPYWLSSEASLSRLMSAGAPIGDTLEPEHVEAMLSESISCFNATSLTLSLAALIGAEDVLDKVASAGTIRPAPLVWYEGPDGTVTEFALGGDWTNRVNVVTPARRVVPKADLERLAGWPGSAAMTQARWNPDRE